MPLKWIYIAWKAIFNRNNFYINKKVVDKIGLSTAYGVVALA
ncbi:hypothetical protein CF049_12990 [Clostridium sporogenes]|nr:hypothetical protein RSJ11_03170 [Clostridium sporogenes]AVQ54807.1 hypothetical protein C7M59_01665 [Clostridium botulinum]